MSEEEKKEMKADLEATGLPQRARDAAAKAQRRAA
jgi:hypothetical protein